MDERVVKKLIASITCGSCGQPYEDAHIDIIDHKEGLWFLRVVCSACHNSSLVAAIVREDTRPELITDLSRAELEKFRDGERVGDDDLLAMHDFLKEFDGDFPRLFGQD